MHQYSAYYERRINVWLWKLLTWPQLKHVQMWWDPRKCNQIIFPTFSHTPFSHGQLVFAKICLPLSLALSLKGYQFLLPRVFYLFARLFHALIVYLLLLLSLCFGWLISFAQSNQLPKILCTLQNNPDIGLFELAGITWLIPSHIPGSRQWMIKVIQMMTQRNLDSIW